MKRFSPLMLELVFMILIFSLCATVCMNILVNARQLSLKSQQLTQAVYLAETTAARLQAGVPYKGGIEGDYTVLLETEQLESALTDIMITVKYEDEQIYSLTVTLEATS